MCTSPQFSLLHVSGSAYKIVNSRAYHHGTMLISAQLHKLGDVLKNTKVSPFDPCICLLIVTLDQTDLVTKGVASVRSLVQNLQKWNPQLSHEDIAQAVIREFHATYGGDIQVPLPKPPLISHRCLTNFTFPSQTREVEESVMSSHPGVKAVFDELQVSFTFYAYLCLSLFPGRIFRLGNGLMGKHLNLHIYFKAHLNGVIL